MTKRERVLAAIRGEEVDRPPAGFWGHDYLREWSAEGLATATVEFTNRYEWDFQKVNPRATYYAEAWGATYRPDPQGLRSPAATSVPLKTARDLLQIERQDGRRGPFAEQLDALRLIATAYEGKTPFIQTVFSPLSVIGYLANRDIPLVRRWMDESPADLGAALDAVTETLVEYVGAVLGTGTSGIFFATVDFGTRDSMTEEQYEVFGRPYDLRVLAAADGAGFNVLHVCRRNSMVMRLLDYPVHVVNWAESQPTNPSLADVLKATGKAVMGGIDHETIVEADDAGVDAQLQHARQQSGDRRLFVGPGCSVPPATPPARLQRVRDFLGRDTGE